MVQDDTEFDRFVATASTSLRRALVGHIPPQAVDDALGEAMAWAWENWEKLQKMDSPVGYLFRVSQSKSRQRKQGLLPAPADHELPAVEPGLVPALKRLTDAQRSAVWLIDGCGWTYAETADAMNISASAVGTHRSRGLSNLRTHLGVQ